MHFKMIILIVIWRICLSEARTDARRPIRKLLLYPRLQITAMAMCHQMTMGDKGIVRFELYIDEKIDRIQ